MNNELQEHKTRDKIKWICTLIAFIIVGVTLIGIICGMVANKKEGQPQKSEEQTAVLAEKTVSKATAATYLTRSVSTVEYTADTDEISAQSDSTGELSDWLDNHMDGWTSVYSTNQYVTIPLKMGYNGSTIANLEAWVLGFKQTLPKGGTADYYVQVDIRDYTVAYKYFTLYSSLSGATSGTSSSGNYFYYQLSRTSSISASEVELPASNLVSGCYLYCTPKSSTPMPEDPVKEGYTFTGWYYGSDNGCNGNCTRYENNVIFEDTTLHAHFEINRYTVTFNSNGGSAVDNLTVDWNSTITPEVPKRAGYNFLGWYKSDGTKYEGEAITADMPLTARWEVYYADCNFLCGR